MLPIRDTAQRTLPSWASTFTFAALAAVLVVLGELPPVDAAWAVASVAAVFVPTAVVEPVGWRRRVAEAALLPAAWAVVMSGGTQMGRMLLPPLLMAAAAAALSAALPRASALHRALLVGGFGLALRAAAGTGLYGHHWLTIVIVLTASAVVPWGVARWGTLLGVVAALALAAVPLQRWPWAAAVLAVAAVWAYPWARRNDRLLELARGWLPGVAAACFVAGALAPWGGLAVERAFPGAGWPVVTVLMLALIVTPRLPAAAAAASFLAVVVAVGPTQGPTPEHRSFRLEPGAPETVLPAGDGGDYLVDLSLGHAHALADGVAVASVTIGGSEKILRVGVDAAEKDHVRLDLASKLRHGLPERIVWRPTRLGVDAMWRVTGRTLLDVADGERPVIRRDPRLAPKVVVVVQAVGPTRPTPPRDWSLPVWMWATAAAVVLLQLAAGSWRSPWSMLPWTFLAIGQLLARASVEPLRILAERHAVDLALAALLAAWLAAAARWLPRGRWFRTAAALLLPLAIATPHLTAPLYGDEPFHLVVMESLAIDRDLDISDNLNLDSRPHNRSYAVNDRLLHSPVLGLLLLPGYLLAGRSGALVVLALAGAALVALLLLRAAQLGVPRRRLPLLALLLALTYPLATFATQIWPEVVGALAVALILVIAAGGRGGPWLAVVVALVAAAVKTRLALVAFPPAAVPWFRGGGRRPWLGALVLALAAASSLAVGWLTMGHPFGYYRRLRHLLPTDLETPLRVVGGLAFDAAGGLALSAPLLLVAVAASLLLWRRGGSGERVLLVGGVLTVAALMHSPEWYGGGSPPARYLVPLLPAFALTLGLLLRSPRRWRRLSELLIAPSLAVWWVLVTRPHHSINPGDGGWWLADALARRFQADTQQLFPSFLVPTAATFWLPPVVLALAASAVAVARRRPAVVSAALRVGVAMWLVAATGLVVAIVLPTDRVVEAEAPQVRRRGGQPQPPEGTFSRYAHRNGWRLGDGDSIAVPLNLPDNAVVWLEGWLFGTAQQGSLLEVRWDDREPVELPMRGGATDRRLRLPKPPGPGRHRLRLRLRVDGAGAAALDRVVVEQKGRWSATRRAP